MNSKLIRLPGFVAVSAVCIALVLSTTMEAQTVNIQTISAPISIQNVSPVSHFSMFSFDRKLDQVDDVMVSQGSLSFSETDLAVPGVGGLGFAIVRNYDSRRFKSESGTIAKEGWGAYGGRGWSFSIGMRATVFDSPTADMKRVAIQKGSESIELKWNSTKGRYEDISPGGRGVATVAGDFSSIRYVVNGQTYYFDVPAYKMKVERRTGGLALAAYGYEIKYVEDPNGNRVTWAYDELGMGDESEVFGSLKSKWDAYQVAMARLARQQGDGWPKDEWNSNEVIYEAAYEAYKRVGPEAATYFTGHTSAEYMWAFRLLAAKEGGSTSRERPTAIADIGKTVKEWSDAYQAIAEGYIPYVMGINPGKLGGVLYNEPVNSATAVFIKYRPRIRQITDSKGRVYEVGYHHLDGQRGGEWDFRIASVGYQGVNGNEQRITYRYSPSGQLTAVNRPGMPKTTYEYVSYRLNKPGGIERVLDWNGSLEGEYLSTRTVEGLNKVGYTWGDQYEAEQCRIDCGYWDSRITSWYVEVWKDGLRIKHPETAYPVVTRRDVTDLTTETSESTLITYPQNVYYNGLVSVAKKSGFKPSYSTDADATEYAFDSAMISDTKNRILATEYKFREGLVVTQNQGNMTSETQWEFSKVQPVKTTIRIEGVVQSESEIMARDQYQNPTVTMTRKGVTDWIKTETEYSTDGAHIGQNMVCLPVRTMTYPVSDPTQKRTKSTVYSSKGQPVEEYEGEVGTGRLVGKIRYDGQGRVVEQRSPSPFGDQVVSTVYEDGVASEIVRTTKAGKTVTVELSKNTGQVLKETDINGGETTYKYDDYGRPIQMMAPNGAIKTTAYSGDLKTTTVAAGGHTTRTRIDGFGRVEWVDNPPGQDDVAYRYYYGGAVEGVYTGQMSGDAPPTTVKNRYTYDSKLRKTSVVTDFGTTSYSYDDVARKVRITDPKGRYTERTTDELGKRKLDYSSADNTTEQYEYTVFGELIQTTDPRGLIHRQDVDRYGRLEKSYATGTTVAGLTVRAIPTYFRGFPDMIKGTTIMTPTGQVAASYEKGYDGEGRPISMSMNGVVQETNGYDSGANAKGQLTSSQTPDGVTSYSYDSMGRVTQLQTKVTRGGLNVTLTTSQEFNAVNGKRSAEKYGDGTQLNYDYDATTQLVAQMRYNGTPIARYTYNPNGTVQMVMLGNGIKLTYTYEKEVLLKTITATTSTNTTMYTQTYSYDDVGLMTETNHNDYVRNRGNLKREYVYSAVNDLRQTKVTFTPISPSRSTSVFQYDYEFDANGNPLKFETPLMKRISGRNFTIDGNADQVVTRRNPELNQEERYYYDGEGRLIRRDLINLVTTQVLKTTVYEYNYQGQLTQVKVDGKVVGRYGYDHLRQRIYRDAPGESSAPILYQWNSRGQIIAEWQVGMAKPLVKYVYSGNQKLAMVRPDKTGTERTYYFINNAQGTPVMIVDSTGTARSRYNLDEWGNPNPVLMGDMREVNYTGKKLDPESGLYYFNQRYYDPTIGRFLTEDPAGQAYNPYLYAGNNPLMYVDPDGELWWFVGMIIGGVVAGWGKDLSRADTWRDIAFGAAVGAVAGAGMDLGLSSGWFSKVGLEFNFNYGGNTLATIGLSQTTQAVSLGAGILGASYSLYSVATPLFKEQHSPGLGNYDPDNEMYPVVVEKTLAQSPLEWLDTTLVDPMMAHTQIFEPKKWFGERDRQGTWSFGGMNSKDPNGLMNTEDSATYKGGRILHRFTDVNKYLAAKVSVQQMYQNQMYDFRDFKCHNPMRDMIDATR